MEEELNQTGYMTSHKQRTNSMNHTALLETHILYAELAYGVIHQHCEVFHCHSHIPICPTALIRPVLVTLVLRETATIIQHNVFFTKGQKISSANSHMAPLHSQWVHKSVSEISESTRRKTLRVIMTLPQEDLIAHYVAIDFSPSTCWFKSSPFSSYWSFLAVSPYSMNGLHNTDH